MHFFAHHTPLHDVSVNLSIVIAVAMAGAFVIAFWRNS